MTTAVVALDLQGPAAPPRSNGELVFAEPWESRIFGAAVAMHQSGLFQWPAFQAELVAAIARWEADNGAGEPFPYYTCWLRALESLLDRLGVIEADQLRTRLAEQRGRPANHDHGNHDHGSHDHGSHDHGSHDREHAAG